MNYITKYFFFFSILIILNNCSGWKNFTKTMSGEKVTTTDEFLIKKKDPLALPPGYEELPLPNTKKKKNTNTVQSSIGSKNTETGSQAPSDLENMVLEELKKNN